MQSKLNPYLHFKDQAKAAMEFYQSALGGELKLTTFKESGMMQDTPEGDNIMHAVLTTENNITIMAADTAEQMHYNPGENISMSLSGDNEEELRGYWNKLSEGATITLPLEKAPWGDTFGMLKDKFGINWMVNIAPKQS